MRESKEVEVGGENVRVTVDDGELVEATTITAAEKLYNDLCEFSALDRVSCDGGYEFPARAYQHDDSDEYDDGEYVASAEELTKEQYEELLNIIDTRGRRSQDIDIKRLEPRGSNGGIYIVWDSRE